MPFSTAYKREKIKDTPKWLPIAEWLNEDII